MQYIEQCRQADKKVVIGTTGYSEEQKIEIAKFGFEDEYKQECYCAEYERGR